MFPDPVSSDSALARVRSPRRLTNECAGPWLSQALPHRSTHPWWGHSRSLEANEDVARLDALVLALMVVEILPDVGFFEFQIAGEVAIERPARQVFGLKRELRFVGRVLVELPFAGFLGQKSS